MENVMTSHDRDWAKVPLADIIDHVITTHHAKLTEELPDLSEYVALVSSAHADQHPELADVHKLFHAFKNKIEQLTNKEETEIFPIILQCEKEPNDENFSIAEKAIQNLVMEFDEIRETLKEIREASKDFAIPEDACGAYKMVYRSLKDIESDTLQHFELEKNFLFKRGIEKK